MGIPLRVLNVEDSEDDALLLLRHLSRAGYEVTFERVDTSAAMEAAMDTHKWDIVITDYVLPHFSGPAAVALSKERDPNLPVVFLSGVIKEDMLETEALQAGAHDYLIKTNLGRLVPAIALAAGVMIGPERAEAHLMLCKEYLQLTEPNLAKATAHAEQALKDAERGDETAALHARALLSLGTCHVRSGRFREAIRLLQRFEALRSRLGPAGAVLEGEVEYQLALALEQTGDLMGAQKALACAREAFLRLRLSNRAEECRAHIARLCRAMGDEEGLTAVAENEAPVPTVPTARWALHLEQAEYHLQMGDPAQAVREAIAALHLVEGDSARCYDCYFMLLRCAQTQGHRKDALNFALSARIMALEAQRHDLAYKPTTIFLELLGPREEADAQLKQLEAEYRRWGLDIYRYLPADLQRRP
ncbi:MAG TPA: response regulator [Symbiobacteriaceae bacterium]|jgi:CheY-like chemotaxis protein